MSQREPADVPSFESRRTRANTSKKRKFSFKKLMLVTLLTLTSLFVLIGAWFFLTPAGTKLRNVLADTLITTQHRDWAKYLIGSAELQKRVDAYWKRFDEYADTNVTVVAKVDEVEQKKKPLIDIKPIVGKGFKGYLLFVSDPKKLRVGVPGKYGRGEKVSAMVKRTGALAGVNGGGFHDPNWKGNGFQPTGIVMSGGSIYYTDTEKTTPNHVVGIDKNGQMIAGKYSPKQLIDMGVTDAVSFAPRFIVNGKGMIKDAADGWGIAPRTCMAQKADGTIMFAIIDGRQPGYSIGATLYDVQKIFLENDAIIAANLDGGASTVLVNDNKIINKPASEYGERLLPTAWLVFDEPKYAQIPNIWENVDWSKYDASQW